MSEITKAIQVICDEKGLEYEAVLESIEAALAAAYRKDFGNRQQNIKIKFNPENMKMKAWDEKEVVEDIEEEILEQAQEELAKRREEARKEGRELTEEEMEDLARFNPKTQIMLSEAKEHKKTAKVGDILKIKLEVPGDFGRMAAQTAKQVVIQRLREAERNTVYEELKEQEGELIQATVQRRDRSGSVIVDIGKVTGILPSSEQIPREQYRPGIRLQFLLLSVDMGARGLEIILSRSSNKLVEAIFHQEIPEIASGAVEIKGIARDPGNRSKVAVFTSDESIDPIGSCIGQRGSRINTIISELGGEKIDIIQYSDEAEEYIKNSLSPAKVDQVELDEKEKEAIVKVAEDQFSLAIGRGGQNVRLAAELTGWKLNVVQEGGEEKAVSSDEEAEIVEERLSPSARVDPDQSGGAQDKEDEKTEEKDKTEIKTKDKKDDEKAEEVVEEKEDDKK